MKLKITTGVNQSYLKVKEGFTEQLFLALNPPFPPVKVKRFDGCQKDDVVILELNFLLFKQIWKSLIKDSETNENEFRFIDEGTQLPFFFSKWRHHHQVIANGDQSKIVDEIQYRTPFILLDWFMWPLLYLQFLYRIPVYKKVFK